MRKMIIILGLLSNLTSANANYWTSWANPCVNGLNPACSR